MINLYKNFGNFTRLAAVVLWLSLSNGKLSRALVLAPHYLTFQTVCPQINCIFVATVDREREFNQIHALTPYFLNI
jgi:hypothetical protein